MSINIPKSPGFVSFSFLVTDISAMPGTDTRAPNVTLTEFPRKGIDLSSPSVNNEAVLCFSETGKRCSFKSLINFPF